MTKVLKFPPPKIADNGFIRTAVAEDILRSIALVRSIDGPAMTLISGAPGVGK